MDNYSARALVQQSVRDAQPIRTVEELNRLLVATQGEIATLRGKERELRDELGRAMQREAKPHPLLGKRVRRRSKSSYGSWKVQRGTMCQNTGHLMLHVGVGQYRVYVKPGGAYVRTLSGRGGYDVRENESNEPWELDE